MTLWAQLLVLCHDSEESDEGDGDLLCLDEAVENILVNEDFADADLTDMDNEDQGENEQSVTVEESVRVHHGNIYHNVNLTIILKFT